MKDNDTWPFCPPSREEQADIKRECRRHCRTPGCACVDPVREAALYDAREDAELCLMDPREAAMNAWDGEREMPLEAR